ncbi:hypothetical protein M8C21_032380 [Ambrosia artemisiifolia]|uniref:Uncharacterized protein n=1 Tax=Ambrosia artemisiifolia TaxID=4212 RepID=A0AAD5CUJ3_AMBAR|nr:hypothetical protein M8C21_032380 [Ambrosia artemisiifolia]
MVIVGAGLYLCKGSLQERKVIWKVFGLSGDSWEPMV